MATTPSDGTDDLSRPLRSRDPRVVVIGAGYAGAHAAVAAARAGGVEVTVIDQDGRHGFLPRMAAVAAGRLRTSAARAPLSELLQVPVEVLAGRAVRLDDEAGTVTLADATTVAADAMVVAAGSGSPAGSVPGSARYAATLHTPDDALALRRRLQRTTRLLIVGAGATGVQLAAEVAAHRPGTEVHLLEIAGRVLPAEPAQLARDATRTLRRVGVHLHLATEVARVDQRGVVLAEGDRLDGTVVWAGGWVADARALLPDAPTQDGRVIVTGDLRVSGLERVLAAGDVAAHRDLVGRLLPMSAQIASQAGAVAGANAAALATGRQTRRARLLELGRIIDLGDRGVGRIGPVPLGWGPTDRLVPLVHRAIDLRHLWQLGGPAVALGHAPGGSTVATTPPRPPLYAVS
ncbi:MAG: NAD(P)/FAD-dependent oxidoreductase [Nitriliruptoraceae bacterium]